MTTARVYRAAGAVATTKARVYRAAGSVAGSTARVYRASGAVTSTLLADAGPDQGGLNAFDVVQLTAAGSSGSVTTWSWAQTAGPAVTLTGATTRTPSFVAPASMTAQTYTFALTVGDGVFTAGPDTVTVTVYPHPSWAYSGGALVGLNVGAY